MRAAASSIASGTPSRRRQISATAAALPSVRAKPGRTARARATNSATAGDAISSSSGTLAGPTGTLAGSGSGGTGYSRSACSPSTVRLVATITTPGQRASSAPRSRAAPITCSRLSRMSSQASSLSRSARASSGEHVPASSAPTARATPANTSPGWVTAASGTNAVPDPKRSASRSPTATASRVLPTPPGPVNVTNRTPGRASRPASSPMACSRPTSEVVPAGSGRGPRSARVWIGGKSAGRSAWVSW